MSKKPWAVYCGLGALVLAVYGMTLRAPFVIDDLGFVRDNPVFQRPFASFLRALFSADYFQLTGERTYQPLVTLLHYFIHDSPVACHAAGILMHAANSVLVFLLCRKLKADEKTSLFAALLFALFPASTEAVNISSFRGHTLAFAFSAASLLLWSGPWSWILYAFALLSKETALIVPVFAAAETLSHSAAERRRRMRPLAAIFTVTAAYLALRLLLLIKPAPIDVLRYNPFSCFAWYLRMFAVPYPLCLAHGSRLVPPWLLLLLLALFSWGLWAARKRPYFLLCLAWILVSLLPVLHLIPFLKFNPVSDRYLYMASAGFCALLAKAFEGPRLRYALYAVIFAWGGLTITRNGLYRDTLGLYTQTAACAAEVPQAQCLLGDYDLKNGDFAGARVSYERALSIDPSSPDALDNLGIAQYMLGDHAGARESLERAAASHPTSARVQRNLALLNQYEKNGR